MSDALSTSWPGSARAGRGKTSRAFASLRLHACRLDDRPPLLDLSLVKGGKPLRRLLLARRHVESKIGEARAHRRIGERLHHGAVELGDDVLGRALRREESEPARHVEPAHAALV